YRRRLDRPETHAMNQPATVLITGAAGALGRAAAQAFHARGDRLCLVDREGDALATVADALSPDCLACVADVCDGDAMARAVEAAVQRFGRLDALVHVAGGFEMGEASHAISRESWQRMMDLNAWSFVVCAGAAVPALRAAGGGRIVAVTARAAARGEAHKGAYVAAKSALQRLVESLSAELRGEGIAVNSIAPSLIDTPANRAAMPDADHARWVSTDALAGCLLFLASEAARDVHGQHLVVDGLV
ncbi:MAG: SDR family oxidoreductase, partial [Pseudoxanthomonas sp.]|nr:SDR family oxidoreductase [Pseudoxanthomonas sp.]